MKIVNIDNPYEEFEQKVFVEWLETCRPQYKFSALAQSTYTKYVSQLVKNKKTGVRPGVPDMMVIVENKLVFVEMKRRKGGKVSDEQKLWIDALNGVNNVQAQVCYGADEAISFIERIEKC